MPKKRRRNVAEKGSYEGGTLAGCVWKKRPEQANAKIAGRWVAGGGQQVIVEMKSALLGVCMRGERSEGRKLKYLGLEGGLTKE